MLRNNVKQMRKDNKIITKNEYLLIHRGVFLTRKEGGGRKKEY